ncbi:unnamed protein product [Albugo candida]|uniref:Uncharacterized protein n=1 Tax=Albugo candida TaxID=65357 RepID=A0A024FTF6_9STRA|nr:unnamed protein product [Albugo candida]|eukprot:CCI10385.1 unnamed protein product [Albugo candida]
MEERNKYQLMEHVQKGVEEMQVRYQAIGAEKEVIPMHLQRALEALRQQHDTRTDTESALRLQDEALQSRHTEAINAVQGQLYDQRDRVLSSSVEYIHCNAESKQIQLGRMDEQLCDFQEALNGIVDQLIAEKDNFEQLVSLEQNATRALHHPKRSQSVTETNIL